MKHLQKFSLRDEIATPDKWDKAIVEIFWIKNMTGRLHKAIST
jgi:hypothetical protein